MDVFGRLGPEGLGEGAVQSLVRPVVVAADDVRDLELDVVDDAGELIRGRSVFAQQRRAAEAVASEAIRCLAVDVLAFALADRPFVPLHTDPLEVAQALVLSARTVPCRVRVVYPVQGP